MLKLIWSNISRRRNQSMLTIAIIVHSGDFIAAEGLSGIGKSTLLA